MRRRLMHRLFSVFLLGVCVAGELNAQTTTSGALGGVVTDPSSAVVPDADVEIRDSAKGTTQATRTDREGVYRFFFLAPGRYTLTVTSAGFRKESRAVTVLLGPPVTVNVALEIAKERTTVRVTAEVPLINAENGDVSATMNQRQTSEVPNPGNDLTYIAQTAPGVVMNTDMNGSGNLSNFSILGMPGTSYLYSVDGMNITESDNGLPMTGSLGVLLGQNQIQEATVVTTGYAGQFGGAAGGNINYITKSGANEFHGNAQYYWNGRVLNANDWLSNASGFPRPFEIANQWAGSIGGPIRNNKLFFFFDTEGLRLLVPQVFIIYIPSPEFEAATIANIDSKFGSTSPSDTFYKRIFNLYNAAPGVSSATSFGQGDFGCNGFVVPNPRGTSVPCALNFAGTRDRPSQDALTSGRVDWNVSRTDRAFLRIQHDGGRSAIYSDPISSVFDADLGQTWWQGQLIETHTFGSSAASQFFLAGSSIATIAGVKDLSQALAIMPATLNLFASGPSYGLGNAYTFGNGRSRFQLSEDVVKTRGQHRLGFGASFERMHWTTNGLPLSPGTLAPQTLDAFYQGGVDSSSPETDSTLLFQSFASRASQHFSLYELGLYGQDEWHARPELTLTLALRAEHQSNPVCQNACFARMAGAFGSVSHDPSQPYNEAAGGGSVVLSVARYFTAGTLAIPAGVVLCGPTEGPFDPFGIDPTTTATAATLLITSTSGPFLTLQGIGAGVTDVVFHYPKQVAPTASAPNVYPYTILVTAPGTKVVRSMVTNAYNFLDIESGRVLVQDMSIAAFHNDIKIDHAYDHVTLRNLAISVSWDTVGNYPYPQPIDNWVLSNGTAFLVGRADSLEVSSVIVFVRFTGMLLTDSTDTSQSVRCGYGTGSDIDLDTVQYGIVVTASNTPEYKFTNVDIGSGYGGQAAVQVGAGGSMPPKIEINGGSQRGFGPSARTLRPARTRS